MTGYRPDIDGLRAIAILGVVLYHFGIAPLHGGFIGVDVFYVVSGYLITGIIQRDVLAGTFSFGQFYERRIRRIFPALFVMLALTSLLGFWLLLPSDLLALGRTMAATLLFGSNFFFWRTSGYFDTSSELNPLLHTWSLAVEEQFYIGLPLLLLLVHAVAPLRLRSVLWTITSVSLLACVSLQSLHSSAVFYLAPFRAWELAVGSLLATGRCPQVEKRWHREALSGLALAVLALSLVLVKPGPSFPGWQALAPVLATAALIQVGASGESIVRQVLQFGPMVYVGRISYSLYLWYLPLLTFARYRVALSALGTTAWLVFAASFAVASLSYHFVEQPFRVRGRASSRARLFVGATSSICVLLVTAGIFMWSKGVPGRFSDEVRAADAARYPIIPFRECIDRNMEENRPDRYCRAGDRNATPTQLIWGDSHALAWAPALDQALLNSGRSAQLALESACPPLLGVHNASNRSCKRVNDEVFDHIRHSPAISTVVLIAAWTSYAAESPYELRDVEGRSGNERVFPHSLKMTVAALKMLGKRVWIVGPTPGGPPGIILWQAMAGRSALEAPSAVVYSEFLRRTAPFREVADSLARTGQIFLSDPASELCVVRGSCAYMRAGDPLYRDAGHLSVQGARLLTPFIAAEIARMKALP